MTPQTETLDKQEVPPGFRLSGGWLTDKAKNPVSWYKGTISFKLMKQSFP